MLEMDLQHGTSVFIQQAQYRTLNPVPAAILAIPSLWRICLKELGTEFCLLNEASITNGQQSDIPWHIFKAN